MKRRHFPLGTVLAIFLLTGCAGLNFKWEPVSFNNPAAVLKIIEVPPSAEEQSGILLRLKVPPLNKLQAEENLKIYSRLHDGRGMSLDLRQKIEIAYRPMEGKDSWIQRTVTTFEGEGGKIIEELEISPRGEILRFVQGHHASKLGKFRIVKESRTPLYPEGPVVIGSKWRYEESAEVNVESFWIKEKDPAPYRLEAESELTGFAEVNGKRCAVIRTTAVQTKTQTFKILFKIVTAEIRAEIKGTEYFDYREGTLMAKVTEIRSRSVFPKLNMEDQGQSQSIYRVTG